MPTPKRKRCFLYYVYGYCLGFGAGIIAVIFAWTEPTPNISRGLLTSALCTNLATLITQSILTGERFGPNRDIYRHLVNIIGLFITAGLTGTGTFLHRKAEGLFFLCGVLATALYIMTSVAFIVSLVRTQAYKRQQQANNENSQRRRSSEWSDRYQVEMVAGLMPSDPYFGDILQITISSSEANRQTPGLSVISSRDIDPNVQYTTRSLMSTEIGQGNGGLSITQLALLGIPSNVFLPSYREATGEEDDSPPEYSESPLPTDSDVSELPSGVVVSTRDSPETDQPPDYEEIVRNDFSSESPSTPHDNLDGRSTEDSATVSEQSVETRL